MKVKAPAPDPNVGLAAKGQADIAAAAEKRASDNDAFFRETFAPRYLQQMDDQIAMGRELNSFQMGLARDYDARNRATTWKFQDKFYDDVDNYDTEANRTKLAGEAGAEVERQAAAGRGQLQRNMQRLGLNPNSGMSLSAMRADAMGTSLAKAGAMNMAREAARREGLNLKSMAAGMGGNLTGATAGFAAGAGGAAGIGMNGISAANAGFGANNANWGSTMGLASNAFGNLGQIGMGLTQMQYDANKSNAAGINSLVGKGIGWATGKWG